MSWEKEYEFKQALQQARQITKAIKYEDTVRDIIVHIQMLAEKYPGVDIKDLEYEINNVLEVNNALESAVYKLEEPFEEAMRNASYEEDDDEEMQEGVDDDIFKMLSKNFEKEFGAPMPKDKPTKQRDEPKSQKDEPKKDVTKNSFIMRGIQNEQSDDWGSMSKSEFKRREMEHELGDETRKTYNKPKGMKTYNKPKGMFFYNVPVGKETDASRAGLKQSKSGKWYGYQDYMFGKGRYWEPKNESVIENTDKCPECGGKLVAESELNEEGNKDACYHKVKSRYKVWPSAYASGALVKCRKVGASNWGNKSKK